MTRVSVPGDGDWFELRDISVLSETHQFEYLDLADKLRQDKREALAAVPPENPAMMMPGPVEDIPVRLTRNDLAPINALVESWMVEDSSFGVPVPHPLPLMAGNVLRKALDPIYGALNGDTPKENQDSASTSTST
jgi:hypothetical protein